MLDLFTTFMIKNYKDAKRCFSSHSDLIMSINGLFMREKQNIIEVSEMIPIRGKEDTGGFFIGVDNFTDIRGTKNRFRFAEVKTEDGVALDRYILAPDERDISDAFFNNFAYDIASKVVRDSVDILTEKPRVDYIKRALETCDIMVDELTLNQISRIVQQEFLAFYHRMWSM